MNDFPSFSVPATGRLKKILSTVLLLGSLGLALAPSARAQITISFVYNGTGTTLTYTVAPGTLASLATQAQSAPSAEHTVQSGGLANVTGVPLDSYTNPGYSNSLWGTPSVAATSFSGDEIRFWQGSSAVRVQPGYDRVNGTLTGSMIWTSTSLMGLGFASNNAASGSFAAFGTVGTGFATTVNWSTINTAIPEPSTYAVLVGLAALGFATLRRRARRTEG